MTSYKLKVDLVDSDPSISRTIRVPKGVSFRDLHEILRISMGWEKGSLYEFRIDPDIVLGTMSDPGPMGDDGDIPLAMYEGSAIRYVHDLGDRWEHSITFLGDCEDGPPKVLEHVGDCPPEHCGGIIRYNRILASSSDPCDEGVEGLPDVHISPYDPFSVNSELERWAFGDVSATIPEPVFYEVCAAFEIFDGRDRYFDPHSMRVVDIDADAAPADWLVPIVMDSDRTVIRMIDAFLNDRENRVLARKMGNIREPVAKYRKFGSLMRNNRKYYAKWCKFLDIGLFNLGMMWARGHGYTVDFIFEHDDGPVASAKDAGDTPTESSELVVLENTSCLCPGCGAPSNVVLDPKANGTRVHGMPSPSAMLTCSECGTRSRLIRLNDGYYVGYHYEGSRHPCQMEWPILESYFAATRIEGMRERFDALADTVPSLCRMKMFPQMKACRAMMRDSLPSNDPLREAVMEVVDASMESRSPSDHVEKYLPLMSPRMATIGLLPFIEYAHPLSEAERLHDFAMDVFSQWEGLDPDYFMLRRLELICYMMDERPIDVSEEALVLLSEAIEHIRANPRDFDEMYMSLALIFEQLTYLLWMSGYNDAVHDMLEGMGSFITDNSEAVPGSMLSIYHYRRAVYELTMGDGMASAERHFREVIDVHTSHRDSGPLTVFRSLASSLILYRYGAMEEAELTPMLPLLNAISSVYNVGIDDVTQYISYAMYALMRDMSFDAAKEHLSKYLSLPVIQQEDGVLDEWATPMCIWNINLTRIVD